jgi:hypothetical protein
MDNIDIPNAPPGGNGGYPVEPSPVRIDEGEPRLRERHGEWEAWQTRSGPEVYPVLSGLRRSNGRQPERVLDVPLPESLALTWSKEPQLDCLEIRVLKISERLLGSCVRHRPGSQLSLGGHLVGGTYESTTASKSELTQGPDDLRRPAGHADRTLVRTPWEREAIHACRLPDLVHEKLGILSLALLEDEGIEPFTPPSYEVALGLVPATVTAQQAQTVESMSSRPHASA